VTTHSLAEVAANHLPPEWKDGERWLARRLKRGELRGLRYGRTWTMRDEDIAFMERLYLNGDQPEQPMPEVVQPACVADGLSARSRRRLRSV
jgi:hypothetical protein